jgi:hypothetical protein
MWLRLASVNIGLSILVACGSEHALLNHDQVDEWRQHDISSVDILFVVDDSNSMAEEQEALADGFNAFIDRVDEAAVDFHLAVINTSMDDAQAGQMLGSPAYLTEDDDYERLFRERVTVGTSGSDKEKGLQAALLALSPEMLAGPHRGFLRDEAQLLTVFVSDEDDCTDYGALDGHAAEDCYYEADQLTDSDALLSRLGAVKQAPSLLSTAGILGLENSSCDDAYPGARYLDVVRGSGGLTGDICRSDWSDMLFELGLNTVGEQFRFALTEVAKAETLRVYVDDGAADPDDWYYEGEGNLVVFEDDAIPPRGSTVRAEYIVAPSSSAE